MKTNIDTLITDIKNGKEDSFKTVLKMYHKMIFKIINSFNLNIGDYQIDKEELFQEASLALYQCCLNYEADKNAKFSTFAYMVVKRKLIDYIRDYEKRYLYLYSMDKENYCRYLVENWVTTSFYENPEEYYKIKDFEDDFDIFIKNLKLLDQEIVRLRDSSNTYLEISKSLNISKKQVDNRLAYIRRKYKECHVNEFYY